MLLLNCSSIRIQTLTKYIKKLRMVMKFVRKFFFICKIYQIQDIEMLQLIMTPIVLCPGIMETKHEIKSFLLLKRALATLVFLSPGGCITSHRNEIHHVNFSSKTRTYGKRIVQSVMRLKHIQLWNTFLSWIVITFI